MELAKPALDVGLYTNQLEASMAFWQEQAQVPYDELLKLGGGAHQHRHKIGDSILKINNTREPIAAGQPTGLQRLLLHTSAFEKTRDLTDPDGNLVTLKPASVSFAASSEADRNLTLMLKCNHLAASQDFYGEVLGLQNAADNEFRVGASAIQLEPGEVGPFDRAGIGYRYMTVQVFDVVAEHRNIIAKGGREGMPPTRLGEVAYISFVLDPDGNWIEISQRKSITGSLD